MKHLKGFLFTILKTLHPRYFGELSRQEVWDAWKYFLKVILASFIVMAVFSLPLLFLAKGDIDKGVLEISQLNLNANLQTLKPIAIPSYDPFLVLDTTGNHSFGEEWFFVTNKAVNYRYFGEEKKIELGGFQLTESRDKGIKALKYILIFLLPGLFAWYYIIYTLKYLLIIIPFAVVSYFFSRIFKNKLDLKKMIVLSFYTATPMIIIEILIMPFFVKKFLLTYSPFIGINFSIVAICLYLIYFVSAVRLNGNKEL